MPAASYEVEQKFVVADLQQVIDQLTARDIEVSDAERQLDTYYAHPSRDFASTDEALRIRREEFANGKATSREVLDTISILNRAKFARVSAVYDYNIALRDLHRARGADPRLLPRTSPAPTHATEPLPE